MKKIVVVSLIFFIAACTPKLYFENAIEPHISSNIQEQIADDFALFLRHYYSPSSTTFYLASYPSSLYDRLVDNLRRYGFAITDKNHIENLVFLSFEVGSIDNLIIAIYNIDTARINKLFGNIDGMLIEQSVTNLNFTRPKIWTTSQVVDNNATQSSIQDKTPQKQ